MTLGLKRNTYLDCVISGKVSATYPFQQTDIAQLDASTGKAAVLLLGFRSNHPLGYFAPAGLTMVNYYKDMLADLEANAPSSGFLGASPYLNAGWRTSSSTVMINLYFRSAKDIHTFAHSPSHRAGWTGGISLLSSIKT